MRYNPRNYDGQYEEREMSRLICLKKQKNYQLSPSQNKKAEGRHAVGGVDGLYFRIAGNSRAWVLRIAVGTRINSDGNTVVHRRDMGLGSYAEISLAEARDIARELRKQVRNGIDPLEQKKHDKETLRIQQRKSKTFRDYAEMVA